MVGRKSKPVELFGKHIHLYERSARQCAAFELEFGEDYKVSVADTYKMAVILSDSLDFNIRELPKMPWPWRMFRLAKWFRECKEIRAFNRLFSISNIMNHFSPQAMRELCIAILVMEKIYVEPNGQPIDKKKIPIQ